MAFVSGESSRRWPKAYLCLALCVMMSLSRADAFLFPVGSSPAGATARGGGASMIQQIGKHHAPRFSSSSSPLRASDSADTNDKRDKRSKRRGRRKRDEGSSAGTLASSGLSRYDPSLSDLIEDEKKTALPRLEDLKRGKQFAAEQAAAGSKDIKPGAGPGILLPRELEALKQKEKLEAAKQNKGAPAYFDTMTKVTWGAIAVLIITEIIVQSPLVHK